MGHATVKRPDPRYPHYMKVVIEEQVRRRYHECSCGKKFTTHGRNA